MPSIHVVLHMHQFQLCSPSCRPTLQMKPGGKSSAPLAAAHLPCTVLSTSQQLLGYVSLPTSDCTCSTWTRTPNHIVKAESRSILTLPIFGESNNLRFVVPDASKHFDRNSKVLITWALDRKRPQNATYRFHRCLQQLACTPPRSATTTCKCSRAGPKKILESEFNHWFSALSLRCLTSKLQPTFTQ